MSSVDRFSGESRRTTGVPGLDTLLNGGFKPGSVCILQGFPGSGKTVLANQICFHRAAQDEACLYITVLAESHDRLVTHLQGMSFFDPERIASDIVYESAYSTLEKDGLDGILQLLTRERQVRAATTLALDGLFMLEDQLTSEADFRRFVNSLSVFANLTGAVILLLTNNRRSAHTPEYTMVDTWIELGSEQVEHRCFRYLQVHKFRGSDFIAGRHAITISDQGLRVLPRLESALGRDQGWYPPRGFLSSGIAALDQMLNGGLRTGSTTMFAGDTGIGKTTFGLEFIGQSSVNEPGLLLTFHETTAELREKAALLGIDLAGLIDEGAVEVIWYPSAENLLDAVGYHLVEAVEKRGVRRLFLDGVDALDLSTGHLSRFPPFLTALTHVLKTRQVTTLYTHETRSKFSGSEQTSLGSVSGVAENVISLRFFESEKQTRRLLAIKKVRSNSFDMRLRPFSITNQGIVIGDPEPAHQADYGIADRPGEEYQ